ncbi:hypothetical protein RSOLAG1IB_05295 [Rhizoctonia solani AG-1 IB]|uniref:Uncharacterized protein n=1 Tax=Thanatephorus cucumeris (strain AG1-IB / isolate 7/3/14) TaxID=1108050 RepID=A0A0B7G474_THACB|nr:hypothetical protein RSOLAG1IB_05295 [Rhizoctonia solani AG-1 IB]
MPDSVASASPLSSPPPSRPHSVTGLHHTEHHPHSPFSHPHPHPHPHSHPLGSTHSPRTGSPLARRIENPGNRVQFADDPNHSHSSSVERANHPGRINDMPTGSLSATMAARAASPSITSPTVQQQQQQQQGLPPQRRLSSRRGSMAAVDPWGKHYDEQNQPRSSTSRLTIVRVPSTNAVVEEDSHGHSPSPGPYGGSRSFRDRSHQRRSSWGANSGSDGEGGERKRSRMSFAFSSFTPISPTPASARQGPPQRTGSPGIGSGFVTSFGPAQGRARTRSTGSSGGVDLSSHNPTQDRSGARQPQLSAQQLYELAMASRDPAVPHSTPVQGVSAAVEPAHFTALPDGEILPFLDRPGEVEALIHTPGTQSYKLFTLLGILFPRPKEDESAEGDSNGKTPAAESESSQPMWPPLPGEVRDNKPTKVAQPPSPTPVPSSKAAPAQHPLGLPSQPTQWTYAQLLTHLTQTTREQLPDKEWVLFARACIRTRSEALWERVKGCLGVPNDIYEDEDIGDDEDEESPVGPAGPVGISDLADMSPVARFKALRDTESAVIGSDRAPSDDEHEPEAWIEPVFQGGPGSARGSVSNSPTAYFSGVTGLGGGRGDSKSWAGSVSGRSDGGRMELIGEEEEEEEADSKDSAGGPADKTPEPESPVVGLRIMTAPMSPGFHPAHTPGSNVGVGSGTASPAPVTGETTPSGVAPIPVPGNGAASPTPASPSPSIHQFLGPPMPNRGGGAWISPLSNTISTGGRGLSGMGARGGAGQNSPTSGSGGGWNSPVSGGGGGWNSPLSRGNRDAWNPATERGPGNPIFPSSFARLSLGPTLVANNPTLRNGPPASAYPPFRYLRDRYKWARPGSENDFAVTIASESSDAGGRY